jgi:CHAT domain-containing protein/Tfp pilus assembly protein PilF
VNKMTQHGARTQRRRQRRWFPEIVWPVYLLTVAFITTGLMLSACSSAVSDPLPSAELLDTEQLSQLQESTAAHEQAQTFLEQGRYTEALPLAKQAVALREQVLGPTHADMATVLTTLGMSHYKLIQLPQAKSMFERVLHIHQATAESSDPEIGESLTNLATVMYAAGDFVQATKTLEQSLEIREKKLGSSHPDVAVTLTHLAIAQRGLSRLEQALGNAGRAITILRAANAPRPKDLAVAVNVKGNILARLGNFEAARLALEESLHLFEEVSGPQHPDFGGALAQLAMLERKQGNVVAALPLLEQALRITEHSYGSNNPEVAGILYEIGLVELSQGKVAEAGRRFERAIAIQHDMAEPHPFIALSLIELAEVKNRQGVRTAARELLQQALQIQEAAYGREHTSVAQTLTRLGYLEAQSDNLSSAQSYFSRAVQIREKALGLTHRDVAASLLDLARAQHALGQHTAAHSLYERVRHIIQDQQGLNPGLDDEALSRIWKKDMKGLQDYALLLATLAQDLKPGAEQQSAVADGFTVTQQARGWLMQAAVANVAAQQAIGSAADRALAKRVEELRRNRQELWARLNGLYALADDQRPAGDLARVKSRLADVQAALDQANAKLKAGAPRYAELSQPETLDIDGAQRLLRANEALVSFYTLDDRVLVWLLRADQPVLHRQIDITRAKLISTVQHIRDSLTSIRDPFDVERAAELYDHLLAPLISSLTGIEHLILVPDDVLLPLPFAALLTQSEGEAFDQLAELNRRKKYPTPRNLASYATLPWLAKSYPLTVLPSVSALKLLRQNIMTQQGGGEPFLGFGDPVLLGEGKKRGGEMVASRGMHVSMDALRQLDRLPGTREELKTLASILRVNPEFALFLGPDATETEVHRLNAKGRLGQAKVLAFATHGLLAGEVQGVTQPALVLTPPDVATEQDDGLLSMEDILQLKLPNTEWVILSACNTAGDDGSGESLSGLARAFFFAGAKALLASQWSVDDEATKVLMGETFKRYGGAAPLPPAQALQAGMLALLEQATKKKENRYLAHPYAWAAFFLVGEGAVKNAP